MYQPTVFRENRLETLHALIGAHPLATLVTSGAGGLIANLLPFSLALTGGNGTLRAHMARANDQVEALRTGAETLVIFQGPEAYITPSWYAAKKEHGRVVPTWNYVVVQARGTPEIIEDPVWIRAQIDELTASQENRREHPWRVADAPDPYVQALIGSIVGVQIPVRTIEGKWKVSQNRSDADRAGVAAGLLKEGISEDMASLVRGHAESNTDL